MVCNSAASCNKNDVFSALNSDQIYTIKHVEHFSNEMNSYSAEKGTENFKRLIISGPKVFYTALKKEKNWNFYWKSRTDAYKFTDKTDRRRNKCLRQDCQLGAKLNTFFFNFRHRLVLFYPIHYYICNFSSVFIWCEPPINKKYVPI